MECVNGGAYFKSLSDSKLKNLALKCVNMLLCKVVHFIFVCEGIPYPGWVEFMMAKKHLGEMEIHL